MDNKIKITVEYEKAPKTRINALLAEYEAAQNVAIETEQALTPIINEVGMAKHQAILEQLKPIEDGLKDLYTLIKRLDPSKKQVKIICYYNHPGVDQRKFKMYYKEGMQNAGIEFCIALSSYNDTGYYFRDPKSDFNGLMFGADRGIITHWNKLNIINKLNEALEKEIKRNIDDAVNKSKNIETKLNNLIND